MRGGFAGLVTLAILSLAAPAAAVQVQARGELKLDPAAAVVVVSMDPVIASVLSDDIRVAGRAPNPATVNAVTVTVTVYQRLLAPGTSLQDVSPGDLDVVSMLRAAGATPPPLGDTGDAPPNPLENAIRQQYTDPDDPMIGMRMRRQMRDPSPYDSIPPSAIYDTVIVASAQLSSPPGKFKVVAVAHPNENLRHARELVAERIADAILH